MNNGKKQNKTTTDIKHPPTQTPIRILVCVWWLSTMVIVNIYLGILFGQLVVPRRPRSIETLEELVNQREVEWCVTRGSAMYELFQRSASATVYGQLGLRMNNCTSADQGVGLVLDKGWAFIRERSILTFKMAKEHNRLRACKLQLAKEDFFSVGFGLALQKGSPYLKAFNAALTLMIEDGFVARWQAQYWPQRNQFTECQLESLREGEPLSIKHFISIYLVCSLIICLALIILIYQWVHEQLFASLFRQICLSLGKLINKLSACLIWLFRFCSNPSLLTSPLSPSSSGAAAASPSLQRENKVKPKKRASVSVATMDIHHEV